MGNKAQTAAGTPPQDLVKPTATPTPAVKGGIIGANDEVAVPQSLARSIVNMVRCEVFLEKPARAALMRKMAASGLSSIRKLNVERKEAFTTATSMDEFRKRIVAIDAAVERQKDILREKCNKEIEARAIASGLVRGYHAEVVNGVKEAGLLQPVTFADVPAEKIAALQAAIDEKRLKEKTATMSFIEAGVPVTGMEVAALATATGEQLAEGVGGST